MVRADRALPWGAGDTPYFRNGFWWARWMENGKRGKPVPFKTEEEAIKFLKDRFERKQAGRFLAPGEMTIRDLVEQFIEQGELYESWKPSTVSVYRRYARNHIYPTLGDLRVITIDRARINHWVTGLARQFAPNTIEKCITVLSGAFQHARALDIVDSNPVEKVKRPPHRKTEHTTWTRKEIATIDRHLRSDPMWHAIYRLMLSSGMRPGELQALCWGDIDFTTNTILIRRTVTLDAEGRQTVGDSPKNGKDRVVALSARPRAALLRWQSVQVQRSIKPDEDWVFRGKMGGILPAHSWRRHFDKLIAETGVRRITRHELRHTSATLEMESGTHGKIVSERLGHKDPAFTMRLYQHLTPDLQRDAADALDASIFGDEDEELPLQLPQEITNP